MAKDIRIFRWAPATAVFWLLLMGFPLLAQAPDAPAPPAKTSTLEESVQALVGEVKHLNATILELRSEISRSRQETQELRGELHGALEKLSAANPGASAPATVQTRVATGEPAPPPATPAESPTEARLNRMEEEQQLLEGKVNEQYQTKVESASKYRMKLSGIALLNVFGNSGTVDNQDVPNLALQHGAVATSGSIGATVRQSEIGLEVYGPTLGGARASANVNFDFFGGFSNVSNGVTNNLVRLRTATLRLDWAQTSLVAGQDSPFFSPLSPTSFASLGYPAFSDAGNLWTWTPQVRIEHRFNLSEENQLLLQGGLLDPLSGETPPSEFYRVPQGGEQSRKPAVGSRVAWMHGTGDHALALGIGGYYSRQNYGAGRTLDAWAGTADWNVPLGGRFALSGEFYRGRALGGLGAAEGRSVLFNGPAANPASDFTGLETVGGWTQLKFRATRAVEFNAVYGQDSPFVSDLRYFSTPTSSGYTTIGKNQSEMFNVIYRPRSDLLFALEYKNLDTLQIHGFKYKAGDVNLSVGVLF
jgi:hypothetical protein